MHRAKDAIDEIDVRQVCRAGGERVEVGQQRIEQLFGLGQVLA